MIRTSVASISFILLFSASSIAADWPAMKDVDSNGNGQIDRIEWQKNAGKLKLDQTPVFEAIDQDGNNSVDDDEWAAAEKLTRSYSARCREASASWCKDPK